MSKHIFFNILSRAGLARSFQSPKRVLGLSLLLGGGVLWSTLQLSSSLNNASPVAFIPQRIAVPLDHTAWLAGLTQAPRVAEPVATGADFTKVVSQGDTLSDLFEDAGISQQTLYQVLEADLTVLALDTLIPGDKLSFWRDEAGELTQLEIYFNAARQVIFKRVDSDAFSAQEINIEGDWQPRSLRGQIQGSFYLSAAKIGLNAQEIQRIETLLKNKINFSRELRAGDIFSVLLSEQYIKGESTGNSQILAVEIERGKQQITAYRYDDDNFYDDEGKSLERAFQRLPLEHSYRVSSAFNPHRLHPVTGRITPHNGTDFAMPVGTKVVAPADGVVTLVAKHPYAGRYIVIDHGDQYRTRYLHLSKILVRKGQKVTRGQVIGLSGKSGRVTGAHLHYELLSHGRPVDAMKAKLPMARALSGKDKTQFSKLVNKRKRMMGWTVDS